MTATATAHQISASATPPAGPTGPPAPKPAEAPQATEGTEATQIRARTPILAPKGGPTVRPPSAAHLSDADVERLGAELDALRDRIIASRGARDARYIRRVIKIQRTLEIAGRVTLLFSKRKTAFVAGTAMLSVAKILENMEIGHNVLHGQWDWMRDPDIHSSTWEWDFVSPARTWKHTHNDLHHTWTNVVGKDKDVGYDLLRMDESQPWKPRDLGNPLYNLFLAPFFEWGIAMYDLELPAWQAGEKSTADVKRDLKETGVKALKQFAKDYAATPAAAVPFGSGKQALIGTFTANCIRNVWAHSVIFCGHFPDGVDTFSEEMIEGETRGDWYIRQMIGSGNISGSKLMHIMTGNLSHQIEHHIFPDLPSSRYAEVAVEVREIAARYGLPYTTGPLHRQVYQAWAKVCRLALPPKRLPKSRVNASPSAHAAPATRVAPAAPAAPVAVGA